MGKAMKGKVVISVERERGHERAGATVMSRGAAARAQCPGRDGRRRPPQTRSQHYYVTSAISVAVITKGGGGVAPPAPPI